MGKASSTKKVARAARTGGKSSGTRKNLAFPVAIVVLVALGLGLVAFARSTNPGDGPPALGDHWHAAYGIFICDSWVADLSDRGADKLGIHTHDDGLMHIHPFLAGATGKAATLNKFWDQVGMKVTDSKIQLPEGGDFEGRTYVAGETTCGGEPAEVVVAHWESSLDTTGEPTLITEGIGDIAFTEDLGAFTIAFVPKGADIPPPPAAASILEKAAVDGGSGQPVTGVPDVNDLPAEATQPPAGEGAG